MTGTRGGREADAIRTGLPSGSFDAVVCVFGVFFALDMPGFVAEMWRLVRPGGTVAITTWGPDWGEPASSLFWDCVRELEPPLFRAFNPWDEITTPQALADLFKRAGAGQASVETTHGERHELARPEEFWDVAVGSGYRATIDALSDEQRDALRERLLGRLRSCEVTSLRTDVVFGVATKCRPAERPRGAGNQPHFSARNAVIHDRAEGPSAHRPDDVALGPRHARSSFGE